MTQQLHLCSAVFDYKDFYNILREHLDSDGFLYFPVIENCIVENIPRDCTVLEIEAGKIFGLPVKGGVIRNNRFYTEN